MLFGQYTQKLSEKGRTALPAKFRKEIGKEAIVARWYEGCLVVVDKENWEEILRKLTGKAELITESVRDTDRFILASAYEIKFDVQGRFVIPRLLIEYAGLTEEIVFAGLGTRIEIWNKENWEKRDKYIQDEAGELIEKLAREKG